MRTQVQEKSAHCLERNGAPPLRVIDASLFLKVISVSPKEIHIHKPRCVRAPGWSSYFQVVSRGTLERESAAENLPEGQGAAARRARDSTAPANGRPFRPRLQPPNSARNSVKHPFMRSWHHRPGFDAESGTPPRIRHFVGMSSWGPGRKERER